MGLYYHSLINKVKEDFLNSGEKDLESFLKKNEAEYLKEFTTNETWFAFNMHELSRELGLEIPYYSKIALDFEMQNAEDWSSAPLNWPGTPAQDDRILNSQTSDPEAYKKFDKVFKRFKIERTEMIEITHYVTGVVHNGMGDFSEFKGEGRTLAEAVENVFKEYVEFYGMNKNKFKKYLNE